MLGAFLKQYVHHCPKELYQTAVVPLLVQFCPVLHEVRCSIVKDSAIVYEMIVVLSVFIFMICVL